MLGWNDGGAYALDSYVTSTSIRDGNWDTYLGHQTWLTNSRGRRERQFKLLVSGQRSGVLRAGNTWPWVDPATGTVHSLPAQARFAAGTPNIVPN